MYVVKRRVIMIKPLGERIVIKVIEETEQTSGGIFIPDSAKEKPQRGEVVAVGLGKLNDKGEREPMDVKVGDTILYAKYSGTDVKFDGTEYKILSIKDAFGPYNAQLEAMQKGEKEFNRVIEFMESLELDYENNKRLCWTTHLYTLFSFCWYCINNDIEVEKVKSSVSNFYNEYFSRNTKYNCT